MTDRNHLRRSIVAVLVAAAAVACSPSRAEAGYVEVLQTWTASSASTWQTKDLSGAPFNVPANAVVEIAIGNYDNAAYSAGVRTVGSSLERRVVLPRVQASGTAFTHVTMHVQADASSQIQHYTASTVQVTFVLVGYWDRGAYVELFPAAFTAGASASWQDENLNAYGVPSNAVAEIIAANTSSNGKNDVGVRTNGSSIARFIGVRSAANAGGDRSVTMFAQADGTANATVELYAEDDASVSFYLAGYWSTAPGTYTELLEDMGSPASDATWQDKDLSGAPFNVPGDAVIECALVNIDAMDSDSMGVRSNGSSLARYREVNLGQGADGEVLRMHAVSDASSIVELYHEDVSDGHDFLLLGYWDVCTGVLADVSTATGFNLQTTATTAASGLHWADLDDDGDLDAIITGASTSRRLLSTNEGASFTSASLGGGTRSHQGALVDVDDDGDLDFWHRDEVSLENDGAGTMADAGNLGFADPTTTKGAAAADVNHDGYCDIVMFGANGNWIGHHGADVAEALTGTSAASYGLNDAGDWGAGDHCSSADVNGDGYVDFFYHYGTGKLFLSDGDGTYTENASSISVVTGAGAEIGSAWGDYDNDGDLDLFVPRYASGQRGYLWRNDAGTFTDVTVAAGLSDTSQQRGCAWGDYDNDGDLDLYVCSASAADLVYVNQNDGTFDRENECAAPSGTSHDAVFVDYDNDGDLDVAVTQQGATNVLLQNDTDGDAYLKVRVLGHGYPLTNSAAIGVRVDLYDAAGTTFIARRDVGVARGFGGTEPLWVHFGGTDKATTYTVKVHFDTGVEETTCVPQSTSTTIGSTTISQMLTVQERRPQVVGWQEVEPQ